MNTKITDLTKTEGNDQFYPTPDYLATKMLNDVDWTCVVNVLEPSAGKGDLVLSAIKHFADNYSGRSWDREIFIDCIEIDPFLRAIIKENHISEWTKPLYELHKKVEECRVSAVSAGKDGGNHLAHLREIEKNIRDIERGKVNIIHDNFITYNCHKDYQLILMNPPFADGDMHLLKALEIQKDGGAIICLLNAETLRNPYTKSRQVLQRELEKHEAEVIFVDNAFSDAERKADVNVAIIRVNIPYRTEYHSDIWERMEKAAQDEKQEDFDVTDLVAGDYIEQAVTRFKVEVAASKELIRQYKALSPYILDSLDPEASYKNAILTLTVGREVNYNQVIDIDKYMKEVRLKYWRALFSNSKFMDRLTSKLRDDYVRKVNKMADYDFTLFNIKTVMHEMNAQVVDGVKEAIISCFDKLTAEHSHYPECKQTIHYYNGWKTNKAHKIGKKSIIPTWGIFSSWKWKSEAFEVSEAHAVLSDIEKIFDYLSGSASDERSIRNVLRIASDNGQTKNIELKYFYVDLFKKGTTHIKYKDMELVEKFNIYAARNKNWLPPNYGKTKYKEMADDEKEVVDSFQGEKAYETVFSRADFFLAEPTEGVMMISETSAVAPLTPVNEQEELYPVETHEAEESVIEATEATETADLGEEPQLKLF